MLRYLQFTCNLLRLLALTHCQNLYLIGNGQQILNYCVNSTHHTCFTIRSKVGESAANSLQGSRTRGLTQRCKFVLEDPTDSERSAVVGVCSYIAIYLQGEIGPSADIRDWKFHVSYQYPITLFPDNVWTCDDGSTLHPSANVCDASKHRNCPDLSDEKGCHYLDCDEGNPAPYWYFCRFLLPMRNSFPCQNGNTHPYCDVIPHNYQCADQLRHETVRCTRNWNCPGGEDEIHCQQCRKNYNMLYHPDWINNGWSECGDGTDEPGWDMSWPETLKNSFDTLIAYGALPSNVKNLARVTSVNIHQDGENYDLPGAPAIQKVVLVEEGKPHAPRTCVPDDGTPILLAAGKSVKRLTCE